MVDRGHHIQSIVERLHLGDGHVFKAGPHARALRMQTKVLKKVLGDFAVGF